MFRYNAYCQIVPLEQLSWKGAVKTSIINNAFRMHIIE